MKALQDEVRRSNEPQQTNSTVAEHELRDDEEAERRKVETEYREFVAKQEAKRKEEDRKNGKAEKDFEDQMRSRLSKHGFTEAQIDALVDEDRDRKNATTTTTTTTTMSRWSGDGKPVYSKVHRKYLALDTLRYYDVPWEYDVVSKWSLVFHNVALLILYRTTAIT